MTDFARGVDIDVERLEDVASRFDPQNPEELRARSSPGRCCRSSPRPRKRALERLKSLLALHRAWVDVRHGRRDRTGCRASRGSARSSAGRRAAGGPAEDALAALVGLRLRPRRLREAANMWRAVTDAVGVAARDSLWDYPDLMPEASDIDDPKALIARLEAHARGDEPEQDDMDQALAQLLDEEASGGEDPDQR